MSVRVGDKVIAAKYSGTEIKLDGEGALYEKLELLKKELAEMGEITADSFDIIIPDVLAGKMPARTNPDDRIYAQIIGTGMLDVACAALLLEKLEASREEVFRFDMTK